MTKMGKEDGLRLWIWGLELGGDSTLLSADRGRMKWPGRQSLGIAVERVIMGLEFRKEENGE
jgi:hypothetical protein